MSFMLGRVFISGAGLSYAGENETHASIAWKSHVNPFCSDQGDMQAKFLLFSF